MHYRNAFEGAVAWSNDARMETPPHEYAHEYVDMFREMPIVKKGIENKELVAAPHLYLCDIAAGQLNATILHARANKFKKKDLVELVNLGFSIHWNGISKK